MDEPIISKDAIRARGRAARAAGKSRNDHNMNPGAAAIAEWQAGWDECTMLPARLRVSHSQPPRELA
jgi:hypothetical protein